MTTPLTEQDRSAFYGAAVLGLRALDAGETTPRRFGADAEARWTQFAGALGAGDRIDILLRDAAAWRQLAALAAVLFGARGRTVLVRPSEGADSALRAAGFAHLDAAVVSADAEPEAAEPLLLELVRQATDGVVDDLLKRPTQGDAQTLVLAWPGALARYSLSGALARIVNEAEGGDAPAILLVVPSHADGSAPSIDGRLPVAAPLPSQRLVMPDAWLANAHRAESSA